MIGPFTSRIELTEYLAVHYPISWMLGAIYVTWNSDDCCWYGLTFDV